MGEVWQDYYDPIVSFYNLQVIRYSEGFFLHHEVARPLFVGY